MAHPLADSRARLQRGRAQRQALEREIGSFLDREPYRAITDAQFKIGEPTRIIYRAHIIEPPDPSWPHVVSEIVGNFRSALDYMVCAMTKENGRPLTNKTAYPLFEDSAKLAHSKKQYIGGVPPVAQALIAGWQPGDRQDAFVGDGLSVLARLSNFDKHQALHVIGAIMTASNVWGRDEGTGEIVHPTSVVVREGPFEDGGELLSGVYSRQPDQAPVRLHADFAFDVAFGEGGPCAGRPVRDALLGIEKAVVFLTGYFEAWFAPGTHAVFESN